MSRFTCAIFSIIVLVLGGCGWHFVSWNLTGMGSQGIKVGRTRGLIGCWKKIKTQGLIGSRPLSVPFLFCSSGKGTDTATPLGVEKYGRINFSLGKWISTDPKTPKSMKAHARGQGKLVRTFFRSLTLSQESLFQ